MKKALSCQTPGRALPPPRAVPQRHGGRVPPPDRSEAANQAVDCLLAKQIVARKILLACRPLKFALGRGREVRRCPVPRLPRLACPIQRAAAGASALSPRAARAAPRTAPTPAPTPLACAHHRTRRCRPSPGPHPATILGSRPTPPDAARACSRRRGGRPAVVSPTAALERRAAEMHVAGRCGRRRRGRGVCMSSMRRARADR